MILIFHFHLDILYCYLVFFKGTISWGSLFGWKVCSFRRNTLRWWLDETDPRWTSEYQVISFFELLFLKCGLVLKLSSGFVESMCYLSVLRFSLTNLFFVGFFTAVIYSRKMSAVFGTLRTALNNISRMVELADPAFANRLKTWGRSKNKKKNLMIPVQKSCKSYLNNIVS